jgi:hypothetical protein
MDRIEKLERANVRWRLISLGAALAVAGYALAQGQRNKGPEVGLDIQKIPVEKTPAATTYTNFCRVSVTPEELILDFGLNTQVEPDPKEPVRVSSRVVMNYFTAKRVLLALNNVVTEHEKSYGNLELDWQKRLVPGAKGR